MSDLIKRIAEFIRSKYPNYRRFYTPMVYDIALVTKIDNVRIYESRKYKYIDIIDIEGEDMETLENALGQPVKQQTNLDRLEAIKEERSRIHALIFHCDKVLLNEICKHCKIGRGKCRNNPKDLRSLMDIDQCVDGTMEWLEQEAIDCEKGNTNEREKE